MSCKLLAFSSLQALYPLIVSFYALFFGCFLLSCNNSEPKPKQPTRVGEPPIEAPIPDSAFINFIEFKTDLAPHTATPELQFFEGAQPAGEYLYRATVNFHVLGGDIQNLDILLYKDNTLVLSDRFEIKDTVGYILSISLARQITAPAFDKASVRVSNPGDSVSYGVELKRVSIEPY